MTTKNEINKYPIIFKQTKKSVMVLFLSVLVVYAGEMIYHQLRQVGDWNLIYYIIPVLVISMITGLTPKIERANQGLFDLVNL